MAQIHMQDFNDSGFSGFGDGREVGYGQFRKGIRSNACPDLRGFTKMTKDPLRYFEHLHRFVWVCGGIAAFGCGMLISFNEKMALRHQKEAEISAIASLLLNQPIQAVSNTRVKSIDGTDI